MTLDDARDFGPFLWKLRLVVRKELRPIRLSLLAPLAHGVVKVLSHRIGHVELFVLWPTVGLFRQLDLFVAQGCTVCIVAIGFVRRTETDNRSDNDQSRLVGRRLKGIKGFLKSD